MESEYFLDESLCRDLKLLLLCNLMEGASGEMDLWVSDNGSCGSDVLIDIMFYSLTGHHVQLCVRKVHHGQHYLRVTNS